MIQHYMRDSSAIEMVMYDGNFHDASFPVLVVDNKHDRTCGPMRNRMGSPIAIQKSRSKHPKGGWLAGARTFLGIVALDSLNNQVAARPAPFAFIEACLLPITWISSKNCKASSCL